MSKPILVLDFDGVIHSYTSKWRGPTFIPDPPVPGALEFLIEACRFDGHFEVGIFSARSDTEAGREAMRTWLDHWLDVEFGWDKGADAVTAANGVRNNLKFYDKKPPAFIGLDDRVLMFNGTFPSLERLKAFRPWNKQAPSEIFGDVLDYVRTPDIDPARGTILDANTAIGNGAYDALVGIFDRGMSVALHCGTCFADVMIVQLAVAGYKIVPLGPNEMPSDQ